MNQSDKNRIFLDYASATPVLPEVKKVMEKYWSKDFYNPNAIYEEGVRIKKDVDEYRTKIARILGVAKEAIIFTSGGTEANTWAVRGVKPGRIVVGQDSHPSVSEAAKGITGLPAGKAGAETTLISSVTTDNKLGRKIRQERKKGNTEFPLLHIDASQTAAYFNVGLEALSCDLLTLDSAKLYGPKGIGALVVKKGVKLDLPPLGTPVVPLIAGFAKALEIAVRDRTLERKRLDLLSVEFVELIQQSLPQALITRSLPNVVHILVPGILPEFLVLALDRAGILVSAGPACNSNKPEPPSTPVRFSFGRFTSLDDIKQAVKIFCKICKPMVK
ncbi:MAG: aminotransferase class V-fold PLP-dependent enzyme [Candidatus Zambryskibacteria bacterium]|nr:aminotransferase class V-fold PLP-dependent enzyme [Candidatus Zambryskibacteria bacterium]